MASNLERRIARLEKRANVRESIARDMAARLEVERDRVIKGGHRFSPRAQEILRIIFPLEADRERWRRREIDIDFIKLKRWVTETLRRDGKIVILR